jgi:hypothetical protein
VQIIKEPTRLEDIWQGRKTPFVELLKIVVDVDKEIIAVDAEMHADLEELLIKKGSLQSHIWGANLYPLRESDDFVEFTALINIRPSQGNKSMEVLDEALKQRMKTVIKKLILR